MGSGKFSGERESGEEVILKSSYRKRSESKLVKAKSYQFAPAPRTVGWVILGCHAIPQI